MVKQVHLDNIEVGSLEYVRKKRERAVFYEAETRKYYKIWVPNWTQSLCTLEGINRGFYDNETCSALEKLIYDETGQRGYVMKRGKCYKNYNQIVENTTLDARKEFVKAVLKNAINAKAIFHDFAPSNMIVIDGKLSFIDLDAFRSFSLIFHKQKEEFEKFELNVKWKPYESALRDVTQKLPLMISKLLQVPIFKIDDEDSFEKILEKIL